MMFSGLYLTLALLNPSLAGTQAMASACTAEKIYQDVCQYFEDNKDKKEIRTPDGSIIKNPYNNPNELTEATATATYLEGGHLGDGDMSLIVDAEIEFEMDVEKIFEASPAKAWPKRTLKVWSRSSQIGAFFSRLYPNDPAYKAFQWMPLVGPHPADSPTASMRPFTPQMMEEFKAKLGERSLTELKSRFDEHIKSQKQTHSQSSGPADSLYPASTSQKLSAEKTSRERQKKLFEYAKSKMIEMVKKGRKAESLSPADKNLVQRIETVEIKFSDDQDAGAMTICAPEHANAFYLPTSHVVGLCPEMLRFSDAQIVSLFGHEIGHSIDPCSASCAHYQVNQQMMNEFLMDSPFEKEHSDQEIKTRIYAKALDADESRFTVGTPYWGKVTQELESRKILELKSPALSSSQHPYAKIRSCLVEEEKFDDVTEEDFKAGVALWKSYKRRADDHYTLAQEADYIESLRRNKDCDGVFVKVSEMNEAMSDVGGAYVLSQYLNEHPPKSPVEAYASLGFFFENSCGKREQYLKLSPEQMLKVAHPDSKKRIERIFLKFPGVAKHFSKDFNSCKLSPMSECFKSFQYLENGKNATVPASGSRKEGSRK